jgi:hypothetical protein
MQELKDEAQAELSSAQESVTGVQEEVDAQRADVIKAETILDNEVVKHGGESLLAAREEERAQAEAEASAAEAAERWELGPKPQTRLNGGDSDAKAAGLWSLSR